jgi:predicted nucleic acid-binding protein
MGWVTCLHRAVVGLDTAPLSYYIEEHPTYLPIVDPFFDALADGNLQVVTSIITLLEVFVQPLRHNNGSLATRYRQLLLRTRGLTIMPVTGAIAESAAQLRATYNIRIADAIQLATTLHADAPHFVTNDRRLPTLPGLTIIVLDEINDNDHLSNP